jgi:hypothetical protein
MSRLAENSRWTRCREALGHEPRPAEFIVWINEQWRAFFVATGRRDFGHSRQRYHGDAFDAWLVEQQEAAA